MDNWLQQSAEFVLVAIQNPTLSQEEIGVKLGINQAAVSRRQKRSNYELMMQVDRYLSLIHIFFSVGILPVKSSFAIGQPPKP